MWEPKWLCRVQGCVYANAPLLLPTLWTGFPRMLTHTQPSNQLPFLVIPNPQSNHSQGLTLRE